MTTTDTTRGPQAHTQMSKTKEVNMDNFLFTCRAAQRGGFILSSREGSMLPQTVVTVGAMILDALEAIQGGQGLDVAQGILMTRVIWNGTLVGENSIEVTDHLNWATQATTDLGVEIQLQQAWDLMAETNGDFRYYA